MTPSRRNLIRSAASGSVALAALSGPKALAVAGPWPSQPTGVDLGQASREERELRVVNVEGLEDDARKLLSPGRFAVMGPAGDGWTYHENHRAFDDYPIMPRRLQGSATIDLSTTLLGHTLPLPIFTSPIGQQAEFHVRGEPANAEGTGLAGALFVASGVSSRPLEEMAKATPAPKWFQIYMNRDPEVNRWLVQRARNAGYTAIILTADALGPGQSDDFIRLGRPRPPGMTAGNYDPVLGGHGDFNNLRHDLSFADIDFLREASGLPVVVKGVVAPDDIREALAHGAAGIWVSNHGGRQLDGVPATITMLRTAAETVAGRVPVLLDGGVRRGIDVFRALALGATAVGIGRPTIWGLINGGALGVKSVYAQLTGELRSAMLMSGVAKVTAIKPSYIARADLR